MVGVIRLRLQRQITPEAMTLLEPLRVIKRLYELLTVSGSCLARSSVNDLP